MSKAFTIGRLFGIQVRLHYTWFIIFTLVTVSLVYPNWLNLFSWVMGIITSLLFFASVLAHELAHSLVGRASGVPIKSITLFIFGGMAHMTREAKRATEELKMAAAGPACSLAISGFFGLLFLWFRTQGALAPLADMARWLALVNVMLAVFNLIPGFPLDGGRVFRSLLWQGTGNYTRSTIIATRVGQGVGYLFILGGILIIIRYDWFTGLWLAVIGLFLENAASASYRQAQWHKALQGATAADVMTSEYPVAPADITISQLVKDYILPGGQHFFTVAEDNRLQGIITLHNIKAAPRRTWDTTRVGELMTPASKLAIAHPGQDALSILEQMDEGDMNQVPVASDGRVVGFVTRDKLIKFIRTRS